MDTTSNYEKYHDVFIQCVDLGRFLAGEEDGWVSLDYLKSDTGLSEDIVVKLCFITWGRDEIEVLPEAGDKFLVRLVEK